MRQKGVEAKHDIIYKSDSLLKQAPTCSHSLNYRNSLLFFKSKVLNISDFTMHLIIPKMLRIQKYR